MPVGRAALDAALRESIQGRPRDRHHRVYEDARHHRVAQDLRHRLSRAGRDHLGLRRLELLLAADRLPEFLRLEQPVAIPREFARHIERRRK